MLKYVYLLLLLGLSKELLFGVIVQAQHSAEKNELEYSDPYHQLRDSLRRLPSPHPNALTILSSLANFFRQDDYNLDSAQHYTRQILLLAEQLDDSSMVGRSRRMLSMIYHDQNNNQRAKAEVLQAIHYFRQLEDSIRLYQSHLLLGSIYQSLGFLDRALRVNLKTTQYYKKRGNLNGLTMPLNNIGLIYEQLGHLDRAKAYYDSVLIICDRINDPEASLYSLHNLANVYSEQGDYQRAIEYYTDIIEIATISNNILAIERAYNGIGYTHYCAGAYAEAIIYARKSMATNPQRAHNNEDANNLHTIGMAYLKQGNIVQAEKNLLQAHAIATKNKQVTNMSEFKEGLYLLYEQTGDYQKALAYHKQYLITKEKFKGSAVNATISNIEAEYLAWDKERAVSEIAQKKQADESRFKQTIVYVSLLLVAVSVLSIVFWQRQRMVIVKNQQQLAENKFASLRSQMNPHFIFNTINGVQNQILKSNRLTAYQHLNQFADTIRLMLGNATRAFVPLRVEQQLLEHYIALEKERFIDQFESHLLIEKSLNERNPLIPSMILQPVVENAIIHGLSGKETPGTLRICLKNKETSVCCTIEDDGIGREAAMKSKQARVNKHLSMATDNTQARLTLLRRFGYKRTQMTIEDLYNEQGKACGTRVHIELPIKDLK